METTPSRKPEKAESWPKRIHFGRVTITIYRRKTPNGTPGYLVCSYASGKRKLISYPTEAEALDAANVLARRMSENQVLAASLSNDDASAYVTACKLLTPHSLLSVANTVHDCLKLVDDLETLTIACRFYRARHKRIVDKLVSEAVAEFLALKESRKASERYVSDLRWRLGRFSDSFQRNCGELTNFQIQSWLDNQKLGTQAYKNFRTVLITFFKYCVARKYCVDSPAEDIERIKVIGLEITIFSPKELAAMLAVAPREFVPCLAIAAFAGLRSNEIIRLDWTDVDLQAGFITVKASKAKTASRRVVSICDTLSDWLRPYANSTGPVWPGTYDQFYKVQLKTAQDAHISWKHNATRHSFVSYRLAQCQNAPMVAVEAGNSPQIIHKHYNQLVRPQDAIAWFAVKPVETPENVISMKATV
jgi:integrase